MREKIIASSFGLHIIFFLHPFTQSCPTSQTSLEINEGEEPCEDPQAYERHEDANFKPAEDLHGQLPGPFGIRRK